MNRQISDVFHMTYLVITPPPRQTPNVWEVFKAASGRSAGDEKKKRERDSGCGRSDSSLERCFDRKCARRRGGGSMLAGSCAGESHNEWQEVMAGKHDTARRQTTSLK